MKKDEGVWREYIQGVKPVKLLPSRKNKSLSEKVPRSSLRDHDTREELFSKPKASKTSPASQETKLRDLRRGGAPVGPKHDLKLDRRREDRLRNGDLEIEARLDLHGLTQKEAHQAVATFLARQIKLGNRVLLVITGKGRSDKPSTTGDLEEHRGTGVLRASLCRWLEALPESARILRVCSAAKRHGGSGAFYILLKKAPRS